MADSRGGTTAGASESPPYEDRQLLKWIERQPTKNQQHITSECLKYFLDKAAQPRHASNNACIKLCYFLDQCRISSSSVIQGVAISEKTCLELFSFYIEWNEKNQNRSMRQVLELVCSLITRNKDIDIALSLKSSIVQRTLAIITHQAAQPLVKPAFKCLEYLVGKGTISVRGLVGAVEESGAVSADMSASKYSEIEDNSWDDFFAGVFEWMTLPDISPAAGKFLVTIFRALRDQKSKASGNRNEYSASWQRWIRNGLEKNPESLENVKNYLFPPLFKLDRAGSIIFLRDLNMATPSMISVTKGLHAHQLLQLSAMEMGKKAGLIEEPATLDWLVKSKKSSETIVLTEDALKQLVFHASDTVRSLAFSVMVSSLSSIRPFSYVALEILKSCMDVLYSDPDAKFRNEVLSNTKHMIERLRGATSSMAREVENLSYLPHGTGTFNEGQMQEQKDLRDEVMALLEAHKDFLAWYLGFLLGEMIPTASYQRHITALRATLLFVNSGIHETTPQSARVFGSSPAWPFSFQFFTPGAVRLLMDLLLDPFEDVRSTAADILRLATPRDFDSGSAVCTEGQDTSVQTLGTQLHVPLSGGLNLVDTSLKSTAGKPCVLSPASSSNTLADIAKSREGISCSQTSLSTSTSMLGCGGVEIERGHKTRNSSLNSNRQGDDRTPKSSNGTEKGGSSICGNKAAEAVDRIEQAPALRTPSSSELVEPDSARSLSNGLDTLKEPKEPAEEHKDFAALLYFIDRAKAVSSKTGRADYSDGLARSYELLYGMQCSADARNKLMTQLMEDLEENLRIAEKDLGQAVLEAPIHGNFAALRLVWDSPAFSQHHKQTQLHDLALRAQLDDLQQRMITGCIRIWHAVKEILCNDSPEGHLLEDLDDVEVDRVDTKNVLSYSFRAIHESSNLLQSLLKKIKIHLPDEGPLLPIALFEQIGDLTFDQLSNLRHRGAFSTVSHTFNMSCELTQYKGLKPGTKLDAKLVDWYNKSLECIQLQASTTRRSAGIPAMLTGIMMAKSSNASFDTIIKELMKVAWLPAVISQDDNTSIPQVHALNSIKEAFKSSSLGLLCEPYIGNCLQLAVHSLKSTIWAIRNCGLLLLRSLIDTIFGTSVSKSEIENGWDGRSIKIDYNRYPELTSVIEKLLASSEDLYALNSPEIVLPALDILRRAGPPNGDSTLLVKLVSAQLRSDIWHVRDMAARAYCALTMGRDIPTLVVELLTGKEGEHSNTRHGRLLSARRIVERHALLNPLAVFDVSEISKACSAQYHLERSAPNFRLFILAEIIETQNAQLSAALALSKVPDSVFSQADENYLSMTLKLHQAPELRLALLKQAFLIAAVNENFVSIADITRRAAAVLDSDTMLEVLPIISQAFKSDPNLVRIAQAYAGIYKRNIDADVNAAALNCLSQALENKYDYEVSQEGLSGVFAGLQPRFSGPILLNAWVTLSGWMMAVKFSNSFAGTGRLLQSEIGEWGVTLMWHGEATKDNDSRLAAAKAMRCVLSHKQWVSKAKADFLPVLLPLYNTLNDDDSEIREIGAQIVSQLAGVSLVGLAAARWLAKDFMLPKYGASLKFAWNVVDRITGTTPELTQRMNPLFSLDMQLDLAREQDDDLFSVEKPNLYIDEKREIDLWAQVLSNLRQQIVEESQISPWDSKPLNALLNWTIEGLVSVTNLLALLPRCSESDASIFTACVRVIAASAALFDYHDNICKANPDANDLKGYATWVAKSDEIRGLLRKWTVLAIEQGFHESILAKLLEREPPESHLRKQYEEACKLVADFRLVGRFDSSTNPQ
ncbi:uncharacterized protein LY89DRAFT_489399 [Mollisia scopiformis]|uniref:Uncharacterized protein n=1 Tax=Mollisia scopiformis TaxID=149040 RepID=A0A194XGT0_MOLSC|nr:uncharacterized protein LY89DRAFT_489399 [Mollisia scopiformis]KUJ19378.1 hypothetical protein LY89DRAFT_489399 [Mollisia scopiformis]